jgi:hypothetical protein
MKLLIRVVLIVLAIPVGLFLIGFFGVLFGFMEPPAKEPEPEVTAEVRTEETQPYRKPIEADEQSGTAVSEATPQRIPLTDLPNPLDHRNALEWMSANQLLRTKDGLIELDAPRFSSLTAQQALALLWVFKDASNDATGDRRNSLRLVAGYVLMGAAFMPEAERLAFAQDGQLVAWPGSGSDQTRSGEFVLMLHLKGAPDQKRAEVAIRQFAPMLPGSDILSALDRVGAINVSKYYGDQWTYNMEKIAHLSAETLQALRDFIGPMSRFDEEDELEFRYAKQRLDDLIAEKSAEKRE